MPDVGDAHWTFVDLPDGHAWEVWRQGSTLRDAGRDLYGQIRATMQGYAATDRAGSMVGTFPTLDEAAYPLALRGAMTPGQLALERGSPAPRGRHPVVLALAIGLAVQAVLGLRRGR